MSDLTPEKRDEWRKDAEMRTDSASDYGGGWPFERILALLDALDKAESRDALGEQANDANLDYIRTLEAALAAEKAAREEEVRGLVAEGIRQKRRANDEKAQREKAEERIAKWLTENPPASVSERVDSGLTGDLAFDMCAYAERMKARAEKAEAALSRVLADVEALADNAEDMGDVDVCYAVPAAELRALVAKHRQPAEDRPCGANGGDA